ncbi:MAG: 30S ribosomal protein S24e [Thermoprotei archaeon]|nr:MAG: 30S ribosomal protein S24e [Thermoprotei archaeon]
MSVAENEAIRVIEVKENPLLRRKEVKLRVDHFGKGTPRRNEIREYVAKLYNVPVDVVFVVKIKTEYGMNISTVTVHVYESRERALEIESEYIIIRNEGKKEEKGGNQ